MNPESGGGEMAERKTKLEPTRRPKPEDVRNAARRAKEIRDRLAANGYRFSDSTEIIRRDRDSR
jgi:hypothetical protein